MTVKIHAVYRNGAFLPSSPVPMEDGTEVELTVISDSGSPSIADNLEAIAHLPLESPNDGFSGADHDRLLYGENENR